MNDSVLPVSGEEHAGETPALPGKKCRKSPRKKQKLVKPAWAPRSGLWFAPVDVDEELGEGVGNTGETPVPLKSVPMKTLPLLPAGLRLAG